MIYQKSVKLSDEQKQILNSIMTAPKNKDMAIPNLPKELLSVNFDNNVTFALIIDAGDYVKDADNALWAYASLVKDKEPLIESDVSQNVYDTWVVTYEDDTYEVTVE